MASFPVVDDDPATVRALAQLLTADGHDASPFRAGADAVHASSSASFDAVVTDFEMPHIDGHDVRRAAREHQPHACLVVASAEADEKYTDLVNAGACIVADKPLGYEESRRP